jgi:hypothetical protein
MGKKMGRIVWFGAPLGVLGAGASAAIVIPVALGLVGGAFLLGKKKGKKKK